jgi:peptidoglycan/xylan/chitin deacetylase (PgdA/CDA1 family)
MSGHSWHGRSFRFAVVAAIALLVPTALVIGPANAATNTVVSLTFDDGQASQYSTLSMLSSRGLTGTYYINSAMVGSSGYYMLWPQIHDLANAGNEIGGHTLHHTNLTTVSTATATTEVCQDRTNLINNGFSPVTSFAYPEAASNSTAEQIVQGCGYTSARTVGNISCGGCPYAETIPPQDPYYLRTPEPATTSTTLADLQTSVTNAETHGGGWVILTFHGICDNRCTSVNSLTPSIFTAFLDWLAPRSANGTVVRTVGEVMGGPPPTPAPDTTAPTTSIACNAATCSTWYNNSNSPVRVSLSPTDTGGSGVDMTFYTTDGSNPGAPATQYAGPFTVAQTTTVKYFSRDKAGNAEPVRSQLIQIDTAAPTVGLTEPTSGSSFRRGTVVPLAATANDAGSGVAQVVFALDGTSLGADTTASYGLSWNSRKASFGQHSLTAVAYDVAGNVTTSASVTVTLTH